MLKQVSVIIVSLMVGFTQLASAQDVNYKGLQQEDFGDVADLLKSMTPEQRAQVLEQAAKKQKELEKMSPEQLADLKAQLHKESKTIDINKVDPAKLDVSKSKSANETLKDLSSYDKKYQEGKINNPVVKSNTKPAK